jgi:hypothetical protein
MIPITCAIGLVGNLPGHERLALLTESRSLVQKAEIPRESIHFILKSITYVIRI